MCQHDPWKNSQKEGGVRVTRFPIFYALNANSSEMAKDANFKFGTHDPWQSPDMTPEKNSQQTHWNFKQESCTVAKMTARCALYRTILPYFCSGLRSLLCTDLILNEFKLIGFSALIGCWFWTKQIVVTIAAHSDVCLHLLKHHLGVLHLTATPPRRWNPREYLHILYISRN